MPFFQVSNIEESVHYYIDALGFEMTKEWVHFLSDPDSYTIKAESHTDEPEDTEFSEH